MYIEVKYKCKWQLKPYPHYKWTECKRLFNCRTGREIKKTIKGMSIGYWIGKNFITLDKLRSELELIPKVKVPF